MRIIAKYLLLFVLSKSAFSASFNCDIAGLNEVEKMICGSKEVSTMDEQLSEWYTLLNQSDSGYLFKLIKPNLKESQRIWLSTRNKCDDLTCLKRAYRSRIGELKSSYLNFRKYSSKSFIESILKKFPNDLSDEEVSVEELISYTLDEFGIGQYLFTTYQGYGGNPYGHCGGGAYRGFWYMEIDTSTGEVIDKDSVVYGNCGVNAAYLSYTIESSLPIVVKMFVERSSDEEPVQYFHYKIGYRGSNEFFRLINE
ncbi:lysozyme inhibitor LprI family protein [Kangiella sediminilitoris]|uniref:Lysozyme inhibitor LprI N-terminal domain-containing protein n=1 Tax=Kangiella sediminilitoris TaxID=1144748 RepID=A0A1B3B7K6_9GAMM|nr:hypothetical protein [Kangiella sediminilitoris]AOE48771.1 hypothetical protein KS2013_39 [Kangiella sediminilitoris]